MTTGADEVLRFWFGDDLEDPEAVADRARFWFSSDPEFDDRIRRQFGALPDRALEGGLREWTEAPRPALALTLVLDQFPRNLHRGAARSFAYDSAALDVCRGSIERRFDLQLHPLEAVFLYLPLEHAEDRESQARCVSLLRDLARRAPQQHCERFESFVAYAEKHRAVIERFGRFPHRNAALGRESTAEEVEYLESGGETFSASQKSE